jgi:threonine synthase
MRKDLVSYTFTDAETRQAIKEGYEKYGYTMDPHGAVAYLGLKKFQKESTSPFNGVFIETAHPVKFGEVVESVTGEKIKIPREIKEPMRKEKVAIPLSSNFQDLKGYMLGKKF